jgi:hypothetical protein
VQIPDEVVEKAVDEFERSLRHVFPMRFLSSRSTRRPNIGHTRS